MNNADAQYINLCRDILTNGNVKGDRTGTGTLSKFGHQMRFDLSEGFPLLTTKKVDFRSIVHELLFFLSGATNIQYLKDNKVKIWDAWATPDGEIGKLYGYQWRDGKTIKYSERFETHHYPSYDQISYLIAGLKSDPDSRRHLVSAWNVSQLYEMALMPCHYSFQCYVNDGKLSMLVNQRSSDMFLGNPFNIASYALLTHMLAQVCNLEVGDLIWSGGDCHIYSNHVEQMKKQIARFDNGEVYALPTLKLDKSITDIDDFSFEHIELLNYKSGTAIKGVVAV